jgi:hypothetical protein
MPLRPDILGKHFKPQTIATTLTHHADLNSPLHRGFSLKLVKPDTTHTQLSPTAPPICATCATPGADNHCGACKDIHYCSAACQKKDWPLHKLACKHFAASLASPRGPAGAPRMIWFQPSHRTADALSVEYLAYLPENVPPSDTVGIRFEDARLSYAVELWLKDPASSRLYSLLGGQNPTSNRVVEKVLGSSVAARVPGPMVAVAWVGGRQVDMHCDAMRPIVEHLELRATYTGPVFKEQPQKRFVTGPVLPPFQTAQEIVCHANTDVLGMPKPSGAPSWALWSTTSRR